MNQVQCFFLFFHQVFSIEVTVPKIFVCPSLIIIVWLSLIYSGLCTNLSLTVFISPVYRKSFPSISSILATYLTTPQ